MKKIALGLLATMLIVNANAAIAKTVHGQSDSPEKVSVLKKDKPDKGGTDKGKDGDRNDEDDDQDDADDEQGDEDDGQDDDHDDHDDADDEQDDTDDEQDDAGKGKDKENGNGNKNRDNAKKGLENALENVKGTPAESVIQSLLENRTNKEEQGLDEELTELEGILEEEVYESTLTSLVEYYEANEEWESALAAQKKLVEANSKDKETFKQLGKLYKKAGKEGPKTFVNGKEAVFDVPPVLKEGRTLIPIRGIAESLKANVTWDQETKTVTVTRNETTITLKVGEKTAMLNGQPIPLDVPAEITNGRTVVPFRFISEALKAEVEWIEEGQIIVITEPDQPAEDQSQESGQTPENGESTETENGPAAETATDDGTSPASSADDGSAVGQ